MEEQVLQAIDQYNQEIETCDECLRYNRSENLIFAFQHFVSRHIYFVLMILFFLMVATKKDFVLIVIVFTGAISISWYANMTLSNDVKVLAYWSYVNNEKELLSKTFFIENQVAILTELSTVSESSRLCEALRMIKSRFIPRATKSDAFEEYVERTGVSLDLMPIESIEQYLTLRKKEKEQQEKLSLFIDSLSPTKEQQACWKSLLSSERKEDIESFIIACAQKIDSFQELNK